MTTPIPVGRLATCRVLTVNEPKLAMQYPETSGDVAGHFKEVQVTYILLLGQVSDPTHTFTVEGVIWVIGTLPLAVPHPIG